MMHGGLLNGYSGVHRKQVVSSDLMMRGHRAIDADGSAPLHLFVVRLVRQKHSDLSPAMEEQDNCPSPKDESHAHKTNFHEAYSGYVKTVFFTVGGGCGGRMSSGHLGLFFLVYNFRIIRIHFH
jgi:hypothetical protein